VSVTVAGILVVAVLLAWLLLRDDRKTGGTATGGGPSGDTSSEPSGGEATAGAAVLPETEVLIVRRHDDDTSELLAVDTVTGGQRQLIDNLPVSNPNISMDRTWMVYREGVGAPQRPRLAHPDGSSARWLMDQTEDCRGTGRPAWSHDGGRLAVVCLDDHNRSTSLRVVNLDGEVGPPLVSSDLLRESPTWTGHDTIIFGRSDVFHGPVTLMEVPADGSAPAHEILAADGYWVSQLDWSDNGLLFVRSRSQGGAGGVWLLDFDGGVTELPSNGDVTSVCWSPDGQSAVYTTGSGVLADDQTLWLQGPEGADPRALMSGPLGAPSWGSR
jgi:Tol biopolymer transport system component